MGVKILDNHIQVKGDLILNFDNNEVVISGLIISILINSIIDLVKNYKF